MHSLQSYGSEWRGGGHSGERALRSSKGTALMMAQGRRAVLLFIPVLHAEIMLGCFAACFTAAGPAASLAAAAQEGMRSR